MGGAIAIRYIARYNGYGVCKLVLIDAAAPTGFTTETANKLITETYNDRPKMMQGVRKKQKNPCCARVLAGRNDRI
jgi:non-heme chloroperoxidase